MSIARDAGVIGLVKWYGVRIKPGRWLVEPFDVSPDAGRAGLIQEATDMAIIKPRRPEFAHLFAPPPPLPEIVRARRVTVLVLGIIILSFADLVVTIAYLRANWMMEANPLAAWLIRTTQSPWALAAFKACTVAVCAALLLRLRHFRSGEVAAWCGIAVLTIMSIMWRSYSEHLNDPEVLVLAQAAVTYEDGRLGLP